MWHWIVCKMIESTIKCWIIVGESIAHMIKLAIFIDFIYIYANFIITNNTHGTLKMNYLNQEKIFLFESIYKYKITLLTRKVVKNVFE
jgi:hypothetical protein